MKIIFYSLMLMLLERSYANVVTLGGDPFVQVEELTGKQAISKAKMFIPNGYQDNSSWTSPMISCEQGFQYDENQDMCFDSFKRRGMVSALVCIKKYGDNIN